MKTPVRRLNFDSNSQQYFKDKNIPLEINKMSEMHHFISPSTSAKPKSKKSEPQFYRLKSSPIQLFNSFSPNEAPFLTQNIGIKGGLILSEGKIVTKNICCSCKKSHCLKLYCECFISKTYCHGCNCVNCLNTEENEEIKAKAVQATLERNPMAFEPKIARTIEQVNSC